MSSSHYEVGVIAAWIVLMDRDRLLCLATRWHQTGQGAPTQVGRPGDLLLLLGDVLYLHERQWKHFVHNLHLFFWITNCNFKDFSPQKSLGRGNQGRKSNKPEVNLSLVIDKL